MTEMNSLIKSIFLLLLVSVPIKAVSQQQKQAVEIAIKQADWEQSMELAEDWVDESPQNSEAHYLLAVAIRLKMQQVSKFRAAFSLGDYKSELNRAIELNSNNLLARKEQIGFFAIAPSVAGGDRELANKGITELMDIDVYSGLEMQVLMAAIDKNNTKQEQLLKQLLKLKPEDDEKLLQMALLQVQMGNFTQADAWFLKVTGSEDMGWLKMAQYQRAKWRIVENTELDLAITILTDYNEMLDSIETEINLPPKAASLWRMALAYEHKDMTTKAIDLLRESLRLDASFEQAEVELERLIP